MILVVDNYKTFVGKELNRFKLLTEQEKIEYSADLIEQVVIVKASAISMGAVLIEKQFGVSVPHGFIKFELSKSSVPNHALFPASSPTITFPPYAKQGRESREKRKEERLRTFRTEPFQRKQLRFTVLKAKAF